MTPLRLRLGFRPSPPIAQAAGDVGRTFLRETVEVGPTGRPQAVRRTGDVERRHHVAIRSEDGSRDRVQADLQLFVSVGDARRAGRVELRLELGSGRDRWGGDLLQLRA